MDKLLDLLDLLEINVKKPSNLVEALELEASKLYTLYSLEILEAKLTNTLSEKQLEKVKDLKIYFNLEYIAKEEDTKLIEELNFF